MSAQVRIQARVRATQCRTKQAEQMASVCSDLTSEEKGAFEHGLTNTNEIARR